MRCQNSRIGFIRASTRVATLLAWPIRAARDLGAAATMKKKNRQETGSGFCGVGKVISGKLSKISMFL